MTASSADARRDELVERLFGSALGPWICSASTWVIASGCTGRSRSGPVDVRRAGERGRRQRALRARVAGAAGDGRHPRRSMDPDASDAERRYALPAGHDEVLLDADSLNTWRRWLSCSSPARCRSTPCSRRSGPATASRTPTTAPTSTRARRASPGRCSTASSRPSGSPRCRPSTSARRRSAGACRRHRVRARPVEHRDRPRLPQGHGRRHRPRRGLDRARPGSSCPQAAWRTGWRSTAGTPRIPSCPAATTS